MRLLVHGIREAKKFHNLLSITSRSRKAGHVAQTLKVWDPGKSVIGVPNPSLKAQEPVANVQRQEKMDVLAQAERKFALPPSLGSI